MAKLTCWLTYSGQITPEVNGRLHVMVQARESSPVIDRRAMLPNNSTSNQQNSIN